MSLLDRPWHQAQVQQQMNFISNSWHAGSGISLPRPVARLERARTYAQCKCTSFTCLFPVQSHVATCLSDQSCRVLNPLCKSTEALYILTVPQHQGSQPLLVYSLMPDRIDKIDYFRICQNVEVLFIFRSTKCNNCSPPPDCVLMFIVSIFTKTAFIESNINLLKNSELHSTGGTEKIPALLYHKGTSIFYYFCTQLWMPWHLLRSLHFKNKKEQYWVLPCPTGVPSGSVRWPQGCVCARNAHVLQEEGPPTFCSHCSRSRSGPSSSVQLRARVSVASAHWMGSKRLSHCHSSAGEVACLPLWQLYLKAFFLYILQWFK